MSAKVRIKISYDHRSSLLGLFTTIFLVTFTMGYLAYNYRTAEAVNLPGQLPKDNEASPQASTGMRGFYLTTDPYNGDDADGSDGDGAGVCEQGYHFASLWEIWDTSNLKYNSNFGLKKDDSGMGPPTYSPGWVRTGYDGDYSSTPGRANCDNWDNPDSSLEGTGVYLPRDWKDGGDFDIWKVNASPGNLAVYVWCVEDYAVPDLFDEEGFLPIVIKN